MTTAAPSTALATIQPAFSDAERLALAGFPGRIPRPAHEALSRMPARGSARKHLGTPSAV